MLMRTITRHKDRPRFKATRTYSYGGRGKLNTSNSDDDSETEDSDSESDSNSGGSSVGEEVDTPVKRPRSEPQVPRTAEFREREEPVEKTERVKPGSEGHSFQGAQTQAGFHSVSDSNLQNNGAQGAYMQSENSSQGRNISVGTSAGGPFAPGNQRELAGPIHPVPHIPLGFSGTHNPFHNFNPQRNVAQAAYMQSGQTHQNILPIGGNGPQQSHIDRFPGFMNFNQGFNGAQAPYMQSERVNQIQNILAGAPAGALLAAGNVAYTEMFENYTMAKYENAFLKREVERFHAQKIAMKFPQDVVANSSSSLPAGPSTGAYTHRPQLDSRMPAHISSLPHPNSNNQHPSREIRPPPAPLIIGSEHVQKVGFWTKQEWKNYKENEKKKKNTDRKPNAAYAFLCDRHGNELSDERLRQMKDAARLQWNHLYWLRIDPPTWGNRIMEAEERFSNAMRSKFEEFGLCDGNWKVTEFATLRYPGWTRSHRQGKKGLKRQHPSIIAKVEGSDDGSCQSSSSSSGSST
ncbi:hypothetical protein D9613_006515 [Agrocybe pediades]|uniref:Uncharacterized protein n=1 Tax=Agrocybe pediades TaxID=84607 RepID=A0A8H4QGC9_9AGAR|nr:hypothetical protein D9613_006515 [Agrocybe pediades]